MEPNEPKPAGLPPRPDMRERGDIGLVSVAATVANHDALVRYALALEARVAALEPAGAALSSAAGQVIESASDDSVAPDWDMLDAALSAWASAVGKPQGGA